MTIPDELLDYLAANLTQEDINVMMRQHMWASMTIQQQKAMIQKVIDKILVYNDLIQVYLTVDPVLFTAHAVTIGKRRSRVIEEKMIGMDEKPDFEAICIHAMELDKMKGGRQWG